MSSIYRNIPLSDGGGIETIVSGSPAIVITGGQNKTISLDTSEIVAEAAASVVRNYTAGEVISALKAVYFEPISGRVFKADKASLTTASVLGITLDAVTSGGTVRVIQYGILEDSILSYAPADLVFLHSDGTLSNIAPTEDYLTRVGRAIQDGTILVLIENPITL